MMGYHVKSLGIYPQDSAAASPFWFCAGDMSLGSTRQPLAQFLPKLMIG